MKQNDGGPAFPHDITKRSDAYGMTLRDYFAAKAMQGIVEVLHQGIRRADIVAMCADAYAIADAMLAARDK